MQKVKPVCLQRKTSQEATLGQQAQTLLIYRVFTIAGGQERKNSRLWDAQVCFLKVALFPLQLACFWQGTFAVKALTKDTEGAGKDEDGGEGL